MNYNDFKQKKDINLADYNRGVNQKRSGFKEATEYVSKSHHQVSKSIKCWSGFSSGL